MILPFDRARLAERNKVDEIEERDDTASMTAAERLEETLELSDWVRSLSEATGTDQLADENNRLEGKARLYALPLQLLDRSCSPSLSAR